MASSEDRIRPAAVAGFFYPDDAPTLAQTIDEFVSSQAPTTAMPGALSPKAVIVPHAGYIYSGRAAVQALDRFSPDKDSIRRIILLGPCHRVAVRGLAAPASDALCKRR